MRLRTIIDQDSSAQERYESLLKKAENAVTGQPHPLERIIFDGRPPGDRERVRSLSALEDMERIEALGFAFAVSGAEEYGSSAREYVMSWVRTAVPTGNAVNDASLRPCWVAYDLTKQFFDEDERSDVEKWLRDIADANGESTRGSSPVVAEAKRISILAMIGSLLDDRGYLDQAREIYTDVTQRNLEKNGEVLFEGERVSIQESCAVLGALLDAATVFKRRGEDLYGGKLRESVNWLAEAAKEDDEKFKTAGSVFERATLFDPKFLSIARKFSRAPDEEYPTWRSVVIAAQR